MKSVWKSDGCTGLPDSWFSDPLCCCFHDKEYQEDRPDGFEPTFMNRLYADLDLAMCLRAAEGKLPKGKFKLPSWLVFQGLRLFGWVTYYF
jgi:hypothetical protein